MPLSTLLSFDIFGRNKNPDDKKHDGKQHRMTSSSSSSFTSYPTTLSDIMTSETMTSPSSSPLPTYAFLLPSTVCRRLDVIANWPMLKDRNRFLIGYNMPLLAVAIGSFLVSRRLNKIVFFRLAAHRLHTFSHVLASVVSFDLLTRWFVMPSIVFPEKSCSSKINSERVSMMLKQTLIGLWSAIGLVALSAMLLNQRFLIGRRVRSVRYPMSIGRQWREFWRNREGNEFLISPTQYAGGSGRFLIGSLMSLSVVTSCGGVYLMSQSARGICTQIDRWYGKIDVGEQRMLRETLDDKEELQEILTYSKYRLILQPSLFSCCLED